MSSDPNYPDDIRKYDHDPRSPFYDSSAEDHKESWIQGRADELEQEDWFILESSDPENVDQDKIRLYAETLAEKEYEDLYDE